MYTIRITSQQKIAALFLLFVNVTIAGIALFFIESGDNSDGWESIALLVMGFWAGSFVILTYLYFRSLYLFTMAYLIVLLLFHVGLFAQYAMGLTPISEWTGTYNYWIYQSAWHVILAVAGFGGGFGLLCLLQKNIALPPPKPMISIYRQQLRSIGFGLLAASFLLLFIAIIQLGNILQFSRFELLYGRHDTRTIGVFTMLFPTALIALAASVRGKNDRMIVLGFCAFAFLIILLSGNRTLAMFPALAGVVVWIKLGHKIPKAVLLSGVLFVLLAIPAISYLRQAKSYEDLSLSDIAKSSQQADIQTAFSELGRTFGILAETLRVVPHQEPYRLGYTYLLYIERSVPNIGASVSSDYSRDTLLRNIHSQKQEGLFELSPADWASYHIIPEQFLMGGGTGFSAIAEAYFNFGSVGVLVMFAIMGAFLARLDSVSLPNNYYALLFSTLYFWPLLTTVRNEFGIFVKPAVFITIVVLAWLLAQKFLPGRSRARVRRIAS
jgi:hypothetical protein